MKKIIFTISLLSAYTISAQLYTPSGATNATTNPTTNNVGIGSATPWSKLSVYENGVAGSNQFELRTGHLRNTDRYFMKNIIAGSGTDDMTFYLRHDGQMFVDGNVGIGIENPVSKLDLGTNYSDPSTFPNKITLWSGGANNYFGFGISTGSLDYFSQGQHRFFVGYNGAPGVEVFTLKGDGNVGIGTNSPTAKLDVIGHAQFWDITSGGPNSWIFHTPDDGRKTLHMAHKDATGNWEWSKAFVLSGETGNAAVQGKLEAKEVKITQSPTADFVFEEDYALPKLEDVEKHIKEKKHLPEIASAKVMEKEGVNVGEFQIKLLQKIEELTLYTIEQNKQLKNQQEKIEQLKKENTEIKNLYMEVQELKKQLKSNTTH